MENLKEDGYYLVKRYEDSKYEPARASHEIQPKFKKMEWYFYFTDSSYQRCDNVFYFKELEIEDNE